MIPRAQRSGVRGESLSAGIQSNLLDRSQLDKDQTVAQLNEWVANKFNPFRAMGHIISTADVENFIPVNS